MIQSVLKEIEDFVRDRWTGEVHYSNSEKHPNADEWIYLDVVPVYVEGSISACTKTSYLIFVTVYARNKVQSAKLTDKVIKMMQFAKLADSVVGSWRPLTQGEAYNKVHFRKISFPLDVHN